MATELIPFEPARLFTVAKPLGMEGLTDRELGIDIPRLRLIHSIRSANDIGKPGQWKLNGQLFDKVPLVVLKGHHFRTLMEGDASRPRTVCASFDGRTPLDTIVEPKSDACPTCPYSQWHDGVGGKRIPPPCGDGLALLTLVLQAAEGSNIPVQPAWVLCSKSARQKALDLGKTLVDRGASSFSDFIVEMGAEEQRNEGVVWWTPVFKLQEQTGHYRKIAEYVEENRLHYVPPVFAFSPATDMTPAGNGPDPWDIPV
jgi:hypothetical protein